MSALDPNTIQQLLGIPASNLKQRVEATIQECLDILNEAYPDTNIHVDRILYDLKGTTAGQAQRGFVAGKPNYEPMTIIRLNLSILSNPQHIETFLHQTVRHEVAHIAEFCVYGSAGHGPRWKSMMRLLGFKEHEITRCHQYQVKKARVHVAKYVYGCDNEVCQHRHVFKANRHNRMTKYGQLYRCLACGTGTISEYTYLGERED